MPTPLKTGLPPDLEISGDYRIVFTALDPASGATVSGVVVSAVTVQALDLTPGGLQDDAPDPLLVPSHLV